MTSRTTPSAPYTITDRLERPRKPGGNGRMTSLIGNAGGAIRAIDPVSIDAGLSLRDYSTECSSIEHAGQILAALKEIEGIRVRSVSHDTFLMYIGGRLEVTTRVPLKTRTTCRWPTPPEWRGSAWRSTRTPRPRTA